jgi:hypothetical protein
MVFNPLFQSLISDHGSPCEGPFKPALRITSRAVEAVVRAIKVVNFCRTKYLIFIDVRFTTIPKKVRNDEAK